MDKTFQYVIGGIGLIFIAIGTYISGRGLVQAALYQGLQVTNRSGSHFYRLAEEPGSFWFWVAIYALALTLSLLIGLFFGVALWRKKAHKH